MTMTMPRIIGLWSPAPGCGKSTVASALGYRHGYHSLPFARPLKAVAAEFLRQAGYNDEQAHNAVWSDKESPLAAIPGAPTARHVLQTLGSEWGRECIHRELWVELWKREALAMPYCVADDTRFPNEAAAIRQLGGELWCINRPGYSDQSGHASEAGLGDAEFDRVIYNNGSLEELWLQVP